jgi:SAM-dependent methyltransferase
MCLLLRGRRRARPAGTGQPADAACLPDRGLARSVALFRLFRLEQAEPDRFYRALAADSVRQLESYTDLHGRTVIDIGGGCGYFTAALRAAGATCLLFEPDPAELRGAGRHGPGAPPAGPVVAGAVVADGYRLPVRDGGADVCFSSNVLEHVPDPLGLIDEMARVTRPGGLIYLSFTNWYSPWGGHEMSPWHYLGARYAERRYLRRHRRPPKNRPGITLFPLHVGPLLRGLRARTDLAVVDALPRYYPRPCRPIARVPLLRELATWNLLLILRRAS